MSVTPIFYKQNGTVITGDPVSVDSAEIRYVDIRQLLPERYRHERDWGGFSLSYNGFNREMWSQFRFLGVNGGTNVDEFFTVKSEARATRYDAAWWMPEKSEAIIALGNISDAPTSAVVTLADGRSRNINLGAHATETIREKHQNDAGTESVSISVTGPAGSIIPTGLITAKDGSFNSVIRFYDPSSAKQPNLYGNGFRVRGNTAHMVLKNTTSNWIAVVPKFTPLNGSSAFSLPQVSVPANATTEVDLTPLLNASVRRRDLDVVSIEVTNWGAPGSVIGSLYGINNETGMNYDIPLRDSGLVRTMTGSYPWKINNDFTTVVYITNISDQEAQFIGEVNSHGTKVALDPRKLKPGETVVFDMAQFRDSQTPDASGNRLRSDATQGQFKWSIFGVTNGKLLLIGRAEMVSRSQRISTSYSCNDPCPPYLWGYMDPFPPPVVIVSDTAQASAWETAQYDSGYTMGPYSIGASWSVDSSTISIDPDSGHSTTVTGEDPGDACVAADMGSQERYSWDGQNCYDNNFAEPIGDTECMQVQCPKPNSETTVGIGWDTNDPTLYKYEQTLSATGVSFVGRTVTEQDPGGGGPDTCHFTNAAWDAFDHVNGSSWTVISGNKWHYDFVGYHSGTVSYYRNQGRAPCGTTFQQRMVINCSSGPIQYALNTLSADISSTTVSSSRAGTTAVKTWP
jgi:hypothetical protein